MRITKKLLREKKRVLMSRTKELLAMAAKKDGSIIKEFERCFPGISVVHFNDEVDCLKNLLTDSLELAFPTHLID